MRRDARMLAAALLLGSTVAGFAADANQGGILAKRWCAECHVVAPNQTAAKADVPTFESVAARKTSKQIANFLNDPHPVMPNLSLSRSEAGDLAAYIKTLGPGPEDPPEKAPAVPEDSVLPRRG